MKFAVAFCLLAVMTVYDLYGRSIPARYLALSAVSGFLFHGFGSGRAGIMFSLLGLLVPFFLLGYFYFKDLLPAAFFVVVLSLGSTLGPLLIAKLIFFSLVAVFLLHQGKCYFRGHLKAALLRTLYYPLKLGEPTEASVPGVLPVLCGYTLTTLW